MINKYNQLQGIQIHDTDTKNLLPNRIILAASGFENTRGQVRLVNHLLNKQKIFGLCLLVEKSNLFTRLSINDYEKLCDTDNLGFKESHYKHDYYGNEKFKKHLKRDEEGWYETGLV